MNAARLAFVREKMGVPDTIELGAGGETAAVEQLSAITNGQLADVVIDATGSNKSMAAALAYCAFAGRLVYVGITQQEVSFLHAPIHASAQIHDHGVAQRAPAGFHADHLTHRRRKDRHGAMDYAPRGFC